MAKKTVITKEERELINQTLEVFRIRTLTWKTVREELKTQSDIELIVQAVELRKLIYITKGGFGKKDPLLLELIYRELERRGFEIRGQKRLGITKKAKT